MHKLSPPFSPFSTSALFCGGLYSRSHHFVFQNSLHFALSRRSSLSSLPPPLSPKTVNTHCFTSQGTKNSQFRTCSLLSTDVCCILLSFSSLVAQGIYFRFPYSVKKRMMNLWNMGIVEAIQPLKPIPLLTEMIADVCLNSSHLPPLYVTQLFW